MALLKILQYPDERLHTVAVPVAEITDEIRTLVQEMAETMYAAPGIGLAATQVDVHQQIIVIDISDTHDELNVLINPKIVASSGQSDYEEGCLSVRGCLVKSLALNGLRSKRWIGTGSHLRSRLAACWRYVSSMRWIICWVRYLSSIGRGSNNPVFRPS